MIFGNRKRPKGPGWKNSVPIEKVISEGRLKFTVPKLTRAGGFLQDQHPEKEFDTESGEYQPVESAQGDTLENLQKKSIFSAAWNFYGNPLLERRELAHVVCSMFVIKISDMPVNKSVFRREDLLHSANILVKNSYLGGVHRGHAEEESFFDLTEYEWPNFLAPVNQQWILNNGTEWLYFEAQPLNQDVDQSWWLTPVDHDKYLAITFSVHRYCSNTGNPYRRECETPLRSYLNFSEKIMSSLSLEISEKTAERKDAESGRNINFPLDKFVISNLAPAIHTSFMWSGKGYYGNNRISDKDARAPVEKVKAFIFERIQPRPLPGCVAIADAPSIKELQALDSNWTGAIEHAV